MDKGNKGSVLLVDDELTALKVLSLILEAEGLQVLQADCVDRAIAILEDAGKVVDAIVTDMKMPDRSGLELFRYVQAHSPDIPVIILTAYGTVEAAVDLVNSGAYHYLIKPPDYDKLKAIIADAVEQGRLKREVRLLHELRDNSQDALLFLGKVPEMRRIYETVQSVKDSSCSVLICGETGSGKELIARSLHYSGNRSHRPFVAVNCAAIPHDLLESEMFGYEKGAFTGASQRRVGRIEAAAGGTLFLDEIGELDASVQSKLLRVLQEKEFSRLGDNSAISVDFRLIASSNRNLREEVGAGHFREDLFYRLNVVCIHVPPLRDRQEDIVTLARAFLDEFCVREAKMLSLEADALRALQAYPWPGNVRELRNVIEGMVVLAKKRRLSADDLPVELLAAAGPLRTAEDRVKPLRDLEINAIREAIRCCGGNKSRAADLLGVSRKTLYKRLKGAHTD